MKFIRTSLCAAIVGVSALVSASADTVIVDIDKSASYEQSMKCLQFRGITAQAMDAMSKGESVPDDQRKRFEAMTGLAAYVQHRWKQHIETIKGDRSDDQLNADLEKIGAPLIADANAGFGGDADARARQQKTEVECKAFEDQRIVKDEAPK